MISDKNAASGATDSAPWYAGVTSYQWLILIIASAGWIFDVYEGQIFNLTAAQLLPSVMAASEVARGEKFWADVFLGLFLLGGAVGGLGFGIMADKVGRKPTLVTTILIYSAFSGLTFFAHRLWQVGLLRFLVATGTGGEWAVAASLVAEVFPARARTQASAIFHASSVLGTWVATSAGILVGSHWRYAYLVGIIPALLVAWVMASVKEPVRWKHADESKKEAGGLRELLFDRRWAKRAILGMFLAAAGLSTYWAVNVAGQALAQNILVTKNHVPLKIAIEKSKAAYGYIETIGGAAGLLSFGAMCARFGRKRSFIWIQVAAFLVTPIVCYLPQNYNQLLCLLPIFGFATLAMHAGYAIYFPELFPTRLRATGAGFCFNVGRVLAASMLFFSGWLKTQMDLRAAVSLLGILFLAGVVIMLFLPETKGQPLPE